MAKRKFSEGEKVRVNFADNGPYEGRQVKVEHVGKDAAGETIHIVKVPVFDADGNPTGKEANAGFYANELSTEEEFQVEKADRMVDPRIGGES